MKRNRRRAPRGLAGRIAGATLVLASTFAGAASAEEPGPLAAGGDVQFSFPDGEGDLPLPVAPDRVLTVAVEREGDLLRGVILLTDGHVIRFDGARSRPLIVPAGDAFASTGK
jgi:hypothetical protein